jgi:hypothetical protein
VGGRPIRGVGEDAVWPGVTTGPLSATSIRPLRPGAASGTTTTVTPMPRPKPCAARPVGEYRSPVGFPPALIGKEWPMCSSARIFICARCRRQVVICSHCDRGNRYCGPSCAHSARRHPQREAAQRYQRTRRGRFAHAARQRRYRQRANVTHQGFARRRPHCPPRREGRGARGPRLAPATVATGVDAPVRRFCAWASCGAARRRRPCPCRPRGGPAPRRLEPLSGGRSNCAEDTTVTIPAALEAQILRYFHVDQALARAGRRPKASTMSRWA